MTFPQKCKYVRDKLFLTQEFYAKELGMAFATANHWENEICERIYKTKMSFTIFV